MRVTMVVIVVMRMALVRFMLTRVIVCMVAGMIVAVVMIMCMRIRRMMMVFVAMRMTMRVTMTMVSMAESKHTNQIDDKPSKAHSE